MADIEGVTKKKDLSQVYLFPLVIKATVATITGDDGEPIEGT